MNSLQEENATRFGSRAVDLSKTKIWGWFVEPREHRQLHSGVSLQQPRLPTKEKVAVDAPRQQTISIRFIATVLIAGFTGFFLVWLVWGSLPRPIF